MSIKNAAIWAASPSTTRGSPTPLSSDAKGERIAYASNKSIFLRSIDHPELSTQYTAHTTTTSVARFSPSGFYIASGDVSGMVRVWSAAPPPPNDQEIVTKGEYHIIAGRINDLAWDGDSQRLIAVGDGKERYGHCITADSGNSVGEISGHSGPINCVDIRKQRPLRAATGSDDSSLVFMHGAPFKFNTSVRGKHDRYIYGTQFSPDGNHLVTVGADKRIWLYDGKTGEASEQIGKDGEGHLGSIFGVSWSSDGRHLVTASADQTVRIWDVETKQQTEQWRMGGSGVSIPHQQVGVVWPSGRKDGLIISVDLDGNLNYLIQGERHPHRVVRGHQKSITAATMEGTSTLWTGSYEGRVHAWDTAAGECDKIDGDTHSNYVSGLAPTPIDARQSRIYSVGWDDTLRTIDAHARTFVGETIKTSGQPKGAAVCTAGKQILVATPSSIDIYDDAGSKQHSHATKFGPTCIAASGSRIAVGGDDKVVRIYTLLSSNSLELQHELKDLTAPTSVLTFSSDASLLAAGASNGKIVAWQCNEEYKVATNRWTSHTARVTALAFSPDARFAVSGALDTNVFVWSLANPGKRIKASNAHKDGVNGVAFLSHDAPGKKSKVLSTGGDASVKVWDVVGLE